MCDSIIRQGAFSDPSHANRPVSSLKVVQSLAVDVVLDDVMAGTSALNQVRSQ